jgi:HTH-type transcriptional regulator/antitoxin HigA
LGKTLRGLQYRREQVPADCRDQFPEPDIVYPAHPNPPGIFRREVEKALSTQTLNPVTYGELLVKVQPHAIKDDREYDRLVAEVGRLMARGEAKLSREETSLLEMLSILVEDYDRKHYPVAPALPHKMLAFLLEQRGLQPHDLWPVLGSKSRVSEIFTIAAPADCRSPARRVSNPRQGW